MPSTRFCILCAVEHLGAVRAKASKRDLHIPCSPTGTGEPTHMVCFMPIISEEQINGFLAKQELTIMEKANPLEFLAKWNLKIIE